MQSGSVGLWREKLRGLRQFPRYVAPNKPRAGFYYVTDRIGGNIHEISLGGLFFQTHGQVPLGKIGKLGVELPKGIFRANAAVRSVQPGRGVGLKFISMSSLDRAALQSFCGVLRLAVAERKKSA